MAKNPKPLPDSPGGPPIDQHVFPKRGLQRFTDATGRICVMRKGYPKLLRLAPQNPMFRETRASGEGAMSDFAKGIEDDFQILADELLHGRRTLELGQHLLAARFYALWRVRSERREQDPPAQEPAPQPLTPPQEEDLEARRASLQPFDGTSPERMPNETGTQQRIEYLVRQLGTKAWGVAVAREGEFLLPDIFATTPVVPVSPKICLIADCGDVELLKSGVREANQTAAAESKHYLVARHFPACPL